MIRGSGEPVARSASTFPACGDDPHDTAQETPNEGAQMKYAMQFRPPGFATLPPDVEWEWIELPSNGTAPQSPHLAHLTMSAEHAFGVFETNRALTDEEGKGYQVTKVLEGDALTVSRAAATVDETIKSLETIEFETLYDIEEHIEALRKAATTLDAYARAQT